MINVWEENIFSDVSGLDIFSDVLGLDKKKFICETKQKSKGPENVSKQKNYTLLYFWKKVS